jgi:hypothetical protein
MPSRFVAGNSTILHTITCENRSVANRDMPQFAESVAQMWSVGQFLRTGQVFTGSMLHIVFARLP